ncbi:MAG: hypothetical protein Q8Q81_07090 [Oxalobacteraceae bacterium]|nr:hypothetical protein [Oxalobacteraceae bacterium]
MNDNLHPLLLKYSKAQAIHPVKLELKHSQNFWLAADVTASNRWSMAKIILSSAQIFREKYNTAYGFHVSKYLLDTTITNHLLLYS